MIRAMEAMIRDGDNFDYFKWLRGVREEEEAQAQEKHISGVVPSDKAVAPETGNLPNNVGSPKWMGKRGTRGHDQTGADMPIKSQG